ncbi:hypothetical protein [Streptomyces sp. NPDC001222]|uniref:hypothetical protein n=1 Tax=Streptomyces sp. NPDC001222 TaxID=3364548 RepID=UPI003693902F
MAEGCTRCCGAITDCCAEVPKSDIRGLAAGVADKAAPAIRPDGDSASARRLEEGDRAGPDGPAGPGRDPAGGCPQGRRGVGARQ